MEQKYIIVKDSFGAENPICFFFGMSHEDVAGLGKGKIVSAGKYKLYPSAPGSNQLQVSAIMGSFTLGIKYEPKRNEEDNQLLEQFFRLEY